METSEIQYSTKTKLNQIARLSQQNPNQTFECLMHLVNYESLLSYFHQLDAKKAVGIDGINKIMYSKDLDANLKDLMRRMKDMAYRPGPVREHLIPKEGKPGATRPLGISNFEDKIVQKAMGQILESIYEPLFMRCSYGFRPGKSCHDAIRDLQSHLFKNNIQTVIDIDLKNFFGTIDQKLLENILKDKIKDTKFIRYINRMFKAGILADGELTMSEEGVVQGSACSPILANVYAHYAIDIWIEEMVKPNCKGSVELFRYADDAVICCQYNEDAQRIRKALAKRLEKFKLQINEEKTKLVAFDKQKAAQGEVQETFDFLGFTFYWGRSIKGSIIPKLKTKAKTMKSKLNKVTTWIKQVRNVLPTKKIWTIFVAKLRGHIQYYGVSHNYAQVKAFCRGAVRIVFKWLNRRSQKRSFTWKEMNRMIERFPLPEMRIVHRLF